MPGPDVARDDRQGAPPGDGTGRSYLVLARKWRPTRFDALAGQEHVTRALTNALTSGRIPHAFLFTGIRGVGKTTLARLLARCLNCQDGVTPAPCGVCDACTAIGAGSHPDVFEIDAASRTKVEQMREVLDTVRYAPSSARFKVYILDEVHMLTTQSFNALLKTLEEPPGHVKFIFATTEARKIPATVLSRCQRYDLKRVDREALQNHLARILEVEGVPWEQGGLAAVVRAADGSVRDALSLLDQVIAHGAGSVRADAIRELLGQADREALLELVEGLLAGRAVAVLAGVAGLKEAGNDPLSVVQGLMEVVHAAARVRVGGAALLAGEDGVWVARVAALAGERSMEHLQMVYQLLLKGAAELKLSEASFASLEMLLLRVAFLRPIPSLDTLLQRWGAGGGTPPVAPPAGAAAPPAKTPPLQAAPAFVVSHPVRATPAPRPPDPEETAEAESGSLSRLTTWGELVSSVGSVEPALALRLKQQVACIGFEAGRDLTLRLTHDCFGPPEVLAARLQQVMQAAGQGGWRVRVLPAEKGESRPATLQEGLARKRERRLLALREQALDKPLIRALMERFDGQLTQVIPPGDETDAWEMDVAELES